MFSQPNEVVARISPAARLAATPLGLGRIGDRTQGSSFLATLGLETESLWDSGNGSQRAGAVPGAPSPPPSTLNLRPSPHGHCAFALAADSL